MAAAPAALKFTYSDVKANKTATETDSYGVNNAGAITGDYVDAKGVQHAMVLAGTKLTTFTNKNCTPLTGTGGPAGFGINTAGTVVGWCTNSSGIDISWTWTAKGFAVVNFPKSTGTQATGINDKNEVVGLYFDSVGLQHGFSKIGKTYKSFDLKGDSSTVAYGLNNAGNIAMYATTAAGGFEGAVYNAKTKAFKKYDDPNAGTTGMVAHAVNNKGDVTGTYYDSAGNVHGWLFHAGKYQDINDPKGADDSRSDGINDSIELVGRYSTTLGGASLGFKAVVK